MNSIPKLDNQEKLGVLICGHGSREEKAVKEFADLSRKVGQRLNDVPLEYGYLEFARPVIKDALNSLRIQSINRVIAIPAMLFAAGHAKNDIPSLLNDYSLEKNLKIEYGRELGVNNLMIGAAGARVKEAIDKSSAVPISETLLVVVGRGSSDPDANSNVAKITRMLVEGFGFGWGETVYSGVTFPLVEPGLRHVVKLGFKKVIVFPYFLFSGILINRIREHTEKISLEFPEIEFISANYLGDQTLVIDTFIERINEVLSGDNSMNCALCKYRSNLLGFEEEVGLVQVSHHHHVEGIIDEGKSNKSDDNDVSIHSHKRLKTKTSQNEHHHHEHFPYPHENHPFGPVTLRSQNDEENKNK